MIKKTVTYYNNAKDSKSVSYYDIDYILEQIKNNTDLSTKVKRLRKCIDPEQFKPLKQQLPMIAASGKFRYRNDDPANLIEYSNLLILDFDDIKDYYKVVQFKEKLIEYAEQLHLYAVWISPSEHGVKAIMLHDNTNPEHHYNLFRQVKTKLFSKTPEFDEKCCNLSRTCFLSSDPNIYINHNVEPYHFVYNPSIPKRQTKTYSTNHSGSSAVFTHTPQQISQNKGFQNLWEDKKLINYIDRKWRKDYPDSYKDGNRHNSILSRAKWLCRYGVLYDKALDYLTATFGRHGIDKKDIQDMVRNNYRSNSDNFGIDRLKLYDERAKGKYYRNIYLRNNRKP